jgi:hypothetical protein
MASHVPLGAVLVPTTKILIPAWVRALLRTNRDGELN